MYVSSRRFLLCTGVVFSAVILILGANVSARAQSADDAKIKALQAQVDQLQRTVKQLVEAQSGATAEAKAAKKQASRAEAKAVRAQQVARTAEVDKNGHTYLEHKPGNPLTFYTPGGEITGYGQFDVSLDGSTKNAGSLALGGNTAPVGNFGWMPALSTNASYLGVRGFQRLGDRPEKFIYQLELGIGITATPGLKQSNSNLSDTTDGTLFNRNTWIGFSSPGWGSIKVGKSSSPYESSTGRFNPFAGEIGTYGAIMGNSGGDNRVEFGTRIDHAIWYESPKFAGGFDFKFMFAPGQNRADNSDNIAAGESDCAGGNDPSSGGNPLVSCSDGAFSNVVSTSLSYTGGPLYLTAAYEFHQNVNRSSDIAGAYGVAITSPPGPQNCSAMPTALGVQLCNEDTANEDAAKVAAMYKFQSGTTVGAIFERLHRYVPADLDFQNERTRNGTWVVVSQDLSAMDSVHFGWGHAFRSPGNPGQHNDSTLVTADGASYGPTQNQADMLTAAYKHKYTENLTWYTAVAATFNGPDAHYDLGAGGHGITTDCHDAFNASGGLASGPHCYTGTTIVGVSTGVQWKF
jgi:predicted porin/outer membrane murein-binding lipoprotein Lpp